MLERHGYDGRGPAAFAQRRAALVLIEGGVDGDDAARGVVARLGRTTPAPFHSKAARDGRTCFAETEQGDDTGRDLHQSSFWRAAWVSREEAMRSLGRTAATAGVWRSAMPA